MADTIAADIAQAKEKLSAITPDLKELETSMHKIAYQIKHLEADVAASSADGALKSKSTQTKLGAMFTVALMSAYPERGYVQAEVVPCDAKYGDYQCNSAMPVCQWLKKNTGKKLPPVEIAKQVISNLPDTGIIGATSISPQGFINVTLKPEYVVSELTRLMKNSFPAPKPEKKLRIVVDMSSPNVAKEMHVGHLRSTIIGEGISRLLEYCGHEVVKLNHIGDWGTQFGMLIAHLQDKFPNFKQESPPISDLQVRGRASHAFLLMFIPQAFYKESKNRFDAEDAFKQRAQECVTKLQAREPDFIKAWNLICDVSRAEFKKVYERLDIQNLIERGESFYQDLMVETVAALSKKGVLEEDDGRLIMFPEDVAPEKRKLIPLTMRKTGGGFTYDTSDMAALRHRLDVEKAERIVYIIDNGQRLHMECVFAAANRLGWIDKDKVRLDYVGFGVVLGEDKKKFKSRSGESVRLADLLNEGLERSAAKLKEKARDEVLSKEEFDAAQKAVAYGCIKYSDLSHNRNNDYVFSFDRMLDDKGNTAVYLLYAYTRIRSIGRNAGLDMSQEVAAGGELGVCELLYATNFPFTDAKLFSQLTLEHEKEIKLAKMILKFQEVVLVIIDDLLLHKLCEYMYDLSTVFTEFYDNCYCVERDRTSGKVLKINMGRMLLCEATAQVMGKCFHILGIRPVDKM